MIALLREKKHLFYLVSSCIASFALAVRFLVENPNIPSGYLWIIEILFYILAVVLRFEHSKFDMCISIGFLYSIGLSVEILQGRTISFFVCIKSTIYLLSAQSQNIQSTSYIVFYIYIFVRNNLYQEFEGYLTLVYTCAIFLVIRVPSQNKDKAVLDLFSNIIKDKILIVDSSFNKILYTSKVFQEHFSYDLNDEKEFLKCLNCFSNEQAQSVKDTIQKFQLQSTTTGYHYLEQQKLENCFYCTPPEDVLITQIKRTKINQDEINENDTPQNFYNMQQSEDTPKYGKPKQSLFKPAIIEHSCMDFLKGQKLNIYIEKCDWDGKIVYSFTLKQVENTEVIIDQSKEIEKLTQMNQNKDQLLATVFHDFKTPINGILTILESLEEKPEVPEQIQYYITIIKKNVYLLLYMIYDILDYSRIQKNQLRLCLSEFYINEIIDEVVELIALQAQQKGVQLKTSYNIPNFLMYSDPNRIKQILMNIISNSLKFTESGSISIDVEMMEDKQFSFQRSFSSKSLNGSLNYSQLRKQSSGKSLHQMKQQITYQISITDTGCGIADHIKPKLFNMYATYGSKENPNHYGTGIGLMVCKKLVKLLGPSADIEIFSEENKGTKMTFKIFNRLYDDKRASPNYISVFKQEESSQKIQSSGLINTEKSKFIRSSQLRMFNKPQFSETLMDPESPLQEDHDRTKQNNVIQLLNLNRNINKMISQRSSLQDDDQEILMMDPRTKIKKIFDKKKLGILIVDDQPFNNMAVKILLQSFYLELQIIEAYNGHQAILKLQQFQEELNITYVLMDLNMPILNGWQASSQIRQLISEGKLRHVHIIAISGFDDEQEQERCEQNGFDAFINKPLKIESLVEVFAQLEKFY